MSGNATRRWFGHGARLAIAALLAIATTTIIAAGVALADEDPLDPARNLTLPCEVVPAPGSVLARSKRNIEHVAHRCGVAGTDIELQSRILATGQQRNYAFVGTMGAGFQIWDVTNPFNPVDAGGYNDTGWQNDIQITDKYAVSTFDGVSGEASTASTCLQSNSSWSGAGIDIVKLSFDALSGKYTTSLATCVPNPPGGAHNATIDPTGRWVAISNCCSDWAIDVVDLSKINTDGTPSPQAHVYRLVDQSRAANATKCPAPASGAPCVVVTKPDGSSASGLWDPHDVHFSRDGNTMYVAAINSTFIMDVSEVLDGRVRTLSIIPNVSEPGGTANRRNLTISHQADVTPDGRIVVISDERGGGLNDTSCNQQGGQDGRVGALHFWALAPVDGVASTEDASVTNPRKLGTWFNPNPGELVTDPLESVIPLDVRTQRGCTVHVFRIGGNGTMAPGAGANAGGVSSLGPRQLVTAFYGAGVWFVNFAGSPSNTDGVTEDPNTTWGNTLGWNIQPGADTWSAKEYRGFIYAGDLLRGFDVYACSFDGLRGPCKGG